MLYLVTGALLAACNGSGGGGSGQNPARDFGLPNNSQIRPGVLISSEEGSCTSNFIFSLNTDTYFIGSAAHCFSPDANNDVDPCEARSLPLGTSNIDIENATRAGTLVYSSWQAMQQSGETPGSDICQHNDFALVQIHPEDVDRVHPAAIAYGGPTALLKNTAPVGDTVYSYGQSLFHAGVEDLEKKEGQVTAIEGGGWYYLVSTDNPGVPGDSGSAVLHQSGQALGIMSTVGLSSGSASVTNGVVNLHLALAYAKNKGYIQSGVQLLTWPEFSP